MKKSILVFDTYLYIFDYFTICLWDYILQAIKVNIHMGIPDFKRFFRLITIQRENDINKLIRFLIENFNLRDKVGNRRFSDHRTSVFLIFQSKNLK